MAKKQKKTTPGQPGQAPLSGTLQDSAQHIWLAGLGAFSQAQAQGGKVFEALVKEGLSLQRKTQAAAEEKLTQASERMKAMASSLQPGERGDKLAVLFEERVAKALGNIGTPSAQDIEALNARLDQLDRQVQHLAGAATAKPAPAAAKKIARPAARKTAASPAAAKSASALPAQAEKPAPAKRATARTPD